MSASAADVAGNLFRHEGSRLVATLTCHLGTHRLQLVEDVVQEALVRALQMWPYRGVPENPAAWLTQTAKNLALDQLRREQRWNAKEEGIAAEHERWLAAPAITESRETFADDTLRMMFVCFHPQLSTEAQTALALRTLCGLSPAEITAAFLSSEAAIAACHSIAADDASTNWPRILALYDQLLTLTGSPIATMNRAVAVARVRGAQAGLDALEAIANRSSLESYHLYHAIRGTLAAELGDLSGALTHFRQAGTLGSLPAERDFIARRIAECIDRKL